MSTSGAEGIAVFFSCLFLGERQLQVYSQNERSETRYSEVENP